MNRVLDRISLPDLRTLNYPIGSLISEDNHPPRAYTWAMPKAPLDQGSEGACVGFGWTHELMGRPVKVTADDGFARSLYRAAQRVDPWPGEDYEGTSVGAGANVLKAKGYIDEYRWCFDMNDLIVSLGYFGPVVIGVDWYSGMWDTDDEGFLHVNGLPVGGHCVSLYSIKIVKEAGGRVDPLRSYVRGINSWGPDWGKDGRFYMTLADLAVLWPGGEFCVPMGRHKTPKETA